MLQQDDAATWKLGRPLGWETRIKANDPWVAGIAVIVLSLIAAIAGLVPARRASRIDPFLALRYE